MILVLQLNCIEHQISNLRVLGWSPSGITTQKKGVQLSTVRATVSKTVGREFKSFCPCKKPIRENVGIGRQDGLKIRWLLQPCGFDSHFSYKKLLDMEKQSIAHKIYQKTLGYSLTKVAIEYSGAQITEYHSDEYMEKHPNDSSIISQIRPYEKYEI